MDETTFKRYKSQDGSKDALEPWLSDLSEEERKEVRGDLEAVLLILSATGPNGWPGALCKPLRPGSSCEGLHEILLDKKNRRGRYCHRILGFLGPNNAQFNMLYAFNKNRNAEYEGPCNEARERKADAQTNWNRCADFEF